MKRCIELAVLGLGNTAPNPMVGSVIVHNNVIIGEGYHQKYGEAHAEVNAVNSVKNKDLLPESTLYVSLEPCSHFGKTPPCADMILEHRIPRVVVGCSDPFSLVSGRGIERLRKGGVDVTVGLLESECLHLNRRFITYHEKKRPYIVLKWAQSADRFMGRSPEDLVNSPEGRKISNDYSYRLVHKWRSEEQAILVGTRTAREDDPQLTVRHWQGNNPLRCVIDRNLTLSPALHLFDNTVPTLVFTALEKQSEGLTEYIRLDFSRSIIPQLMAALYRKEIQSLIVEGGAALLNAFIDEEMWDEARIFASDKAFGSGILAPSLKGSLISEDRLDNDLLRIYRNKH